MAVKSSSNFLQYIEFTLITSITSLWECKVLKLYPIPCNVNLFLTSASEPDGAPQNVTVRGQNSSSTSILVMWDAVPADQQNGIITVYTITYHSLTENDNGTVLAGPDDRQTVLSSLKEWVNYNITVFASTVKGDGPASDAIVFRTDQDSK